MDAIQAELDKIYNPDQQAAATSEAETADDESVVDADEEAAADTPTEDEQDEAAEPSDDEDTDSESEDDAADEPDEADESESASIDDLLEPIPSKETLLSRNPRIPQNTKDELVNLSEGWQKDRAMLDRIGGEQGVEALSPILEVLTKSERTFDDNLKAIGAMIKTNDLATVELLSEGALGILFNTDNRPASREAQKVGDMVLSKRFGDGVDAKFIEEAKLLHDVRSQSGYQSFGEELVALQDGGDTAIYAESQATKLKEANDRILELQNLVDNPHLIQAQTAQQTNAVKDLDTEITQRLSEGITPFRERVRWNPESRLTKSVIGDILAQLRNEPEYKEAVNFVKQHNGLKAGDAIPYVVEKQIYQLVNKGKGRFGQTAIDINKELRGLTATSRNAQVKEKVKETVKPKAMPVAPTRTYDNLSVFAGGGPIGEELRKIYAETDAARAGN